MQEARSPAVGGSGKFGRTMPDTSLPDADHAPDLAALLPVKTTREWFELLYHELRRRARGELFRRQALTLGSTTLLHEAWLRLSASTIEFATEDDVIRYTARVMRCIIVDHIRERLAQKRGGEFDLVPYETMNDLRALGGQETLNVSEALEELSTIDRALAELVELKFFAGLTFVEIAAIRKVSERTVQRDWDKARMLLFDAIRR
jgi:RNA polymerase sigma factor (TIGR02999 family)